MGDDIAALGIKIETASLEKGTTELQRFERAAAGAERATDSLAAHASRATGPKIALAKATEQFTRDANAAAMANGLLARGLSMLGGPAGIAAAAFGLLTAGVTAASAAMSGLPARAIEETLKTQAQLVSVVRDRYREVATAAQDAFKPTRDTLMIQSLQAQLEVRQQLAQTLRSALAGVSTPTDIGIPEMGIGPSASVAVDRYRAFASAIEQLQAGLAKGQPDLTRFNDEVSKIGLQNPALQATAVHLMEMVKGATELAAKAQQLQDVQDVLNGVATAAQRARLGLAPIAQAMREGYEPPEEAASAWDRVSDQIEKHIKLMEADAKAVGQGVAAREELRTRGLLEDALRRDGEAVEQYTAQIDELARRAGVAAQQLEILKTEAALTAERASIFRSPTDNRVDNTLRRLGLTEDDARGQSIAQQIRLNEEIKEGRGHAVSFTNDLVRGLMSGKSAMEALGDAATNLSAKLAESAIMDLFTGNFVSAGIKGIAAAGAWLFGKNQQEEKRQAQQFWDAIARQTEFRERAARARIESGTRAGDLGALELTFQRERREEAYKGGLAMMDLVEAQLAERLRVEEEWGRRILDRQRSFMDRAVLAMLDTSTLEGALVEFNLRAQREREAEIRSGGEAMVELEAALTAERLALVKRFGEEQIAETRRVAEAERQIARTILDYLLGLQAGGESPLSPGQRLSAAQQAYNTTLGLAQGGNVDALNRITQDAEALRLAARDMFGSAAGYQAIFQQIQSQLSGLPVVQTSGDPVVQALLGIIQAVNSVTAAVIDQSTWDLINSLLGLTQTNTTATVATQTNTSNTNTNVIQGNALQTATNSILNQLILLNDLLNRQFAGNPLNIAGSSTQQQVYRYNPHLPVGQQFYWETVTAHSGVKNYGAQFTNGTVPTSNVFDDRQAAVRSPSPIEGSMIDLLKKIVWNTNAIAHNTGAQNYRNSTTHLFGVYEQGGWVGGNRHSAGGTRIEAELGEYVVNRRAADMLRPWMDSHINRGLLPTMAVPMPANDNSDGWQILHSELSAMHRTMASLLSRIAVIEDQGNKKMDALGEQQRDWQDDERRNRSRYAGKVGRGSIRG